MPKPLVIIKLGGSALTDKSRIYTPRKQVIHKAASQVESICKKRSVVLIHGAGSFGHIPVKKYGLRFGFKNTHQLRGLAVTKAKLLEWETILDDILLEHDVPLLPFITSNFLVATDGRICSAELKPIRGCLQLGCVPCAGGDIVTDLTRGFCIISGDQLAAYLALKLNASSLIFGVDVDGIFDSNPKLNPDAQLLKKVSTTKALDLVQKATGEMSFDVTGGMAGKIREAVIAVRKGIPVHFVNLTIDGRLRKAALGQRFLGSSITLD